MPEEPASASLKVKPSMAKRIDDLVDERRAPKHFLTEVLLDFAIPRIDDAIDEWHKAGKERAKQKRSRPTPLRVAGEIEKP